MNPYNALMNQYGFRYLHPKLRISPCEKEILKLETMLGTSLPSDYRAFLSEFGGALLGESIEFPLMQLAEEGEVVGVEDFYGFYPLNEVGGRQVGDLFYGIEVYRNRMPPNLLPIASAFCGNELCICVDGDNEGKLYFWDHEESPEEDLSSPTYYDQLLLVAESFDSFIKSGSRVDD